MKINNILNKNEIENVNVNNAVNADGESHSRRSLLSILRSSLFTLSSSLYVICIGVLGLIVSYILGWTNYNVVTWLFVIIIVIGVIMYTIMLKRESKY